MIKNNYWLIIDLIIMITSQIALISIIFSRHIKTIILLLYIFFIIFLLSLFYKYVFIFKNNIYYPNLIILSLLLIIILFILTSFIFCKENKKRDAGILLFPMLTLPFVTHFSQQTELIFLYYPYLKGFFGIFFPITIIFYYLNVKFNLLRKTNKDISILLFSFSFVAYIIIFKDNRNIYYPIFLLLSYILLIIILILGLTRKFDMIFGPINKK